MTYVEGESSGSDLNDVETEIEDPKRQHGHCDRQTIALGQLPYHFRVRKLNRCEIDISRGVLMRNNRGLGRKLEGDDMNKELT